MSTSFTPTMRPPRLSPIPPSRPCSPTSPRPTATPPACTALPRRARPTWSGRGRRSPPASTPGRRRSTSPPAVRRRTTGPCGVAELMALKGGRAATSSPPPSSTTPSSTPPSIWRSRAVRSPTCRWTGGAGGSRRPGGGDPAGHHSYLHHGRQQRDRHHRACRRAGRIARAQRCSFTPTRCRPWAISPWTWKRGMWICSPVRPQVPRPQRGGRPVREKAPRLPALIQGGGQEKGRRSGTENVPRRGGYGRRRAGAGGRPEPGVPPCLAALRDRLIDGLTGLPPPASPATR